MSAYIPNGKRSYRMRVVDLDGNARTVACGTRDAETVEDMAAMVERFRSRRSNATNRALLAALVAKRVRMLDVYDADCLGSGALEALAAKLDGAAELDLDPLVTEWDGRGRKARSAKYLRQVREFIPEGERFPVSRFRRSEIAKFLEELPVNDPTRNRYKAALSQFGNWLVKREKIETNPVRDAGVFSENPARMVWLKPKQARRLVEKLAGEAQFVAALMAVTCAEWQAVDVGVASDVDLSERTFHAHGQKTKAKGAWRDRITEATGDPEWEWAWPIVEAHVSKLAPNAPLVTIREYAPLRQQTAACKALGLPHHTLHDWRHTYAVNAILRGDDHQDIKRQLGHAPNSTVLYTVYGVYIAEAKRRAKKKSPSTPSATPARKRTK